MEPVTANYHRAEHLSPPSRDSASLTPKPRGVAAYVATGLTRDRLPTQHFQCTFQAAQFRQRDAGLTLKLLRLLQFRCSLSFPLIGAGRQLLAVGALPFYLRR